MMKKKRDKVSNRMFFLNDSFSDFSSSDSESNPSVSHAQYLVEHEQTKKTLQEKAKELASKAEAARIQLEELNGGPLDGPAGSITITTNSGAAGEGHLNQDTQSLLIPGDAILS